MHGRSLLAVITVIVAIAAVLLYDKGKCTANAVETGS